MTDQDHSDDGKSFLSRWSQRKQEAKQPDRDAPAPDANAPPAPIAESETGPEFDLSSLPKLEDLTPTTDITAFLRKGVPESLRNAALRKAWALDPAIRNYVNPALDYAYDWNTPGGVPGSSEIGAGVDVARLVSQIMGGESVTRPQGSAAEPGTAPAADSTCSAEDDAAQTAPDLAAQAVRLISEARKPTNNEETATTKAAPQPDSDKTDTAAPQQAVRRHGSAKPVV
jgi:hypothetical protein